MVLEELVGPKKAEKNLLYALLLGIIYSSVALFLSLWIFGGQATLVMVFLTVIASMPLVHKILVMEEGRNMREIFLLKEHGRALSFFIMLFIGFIIGFSFWFIVLPAPTTQQVFSSQLSTISAINSKIAGNVVMSEYFMPILTNNLKVLFFTLLFSLFYGAGAIFVLAWNASVISAAIGTFIRNNIGAYAGAVGFSKVAAHFTIITGGVLRYMTHGIFEIVAYFMAGLAGGIISLAIIRHRHNLKKMKKVLIDSIDLTILAIAVLIVAAFVEVFVTPALF